MAHFKVLHTSVICILWYNQNNDKQKSYKLLLKFQNDLEKNVILQIFT